MSKIDHDLAAALKLAKTNAMNFVLVTKSPGESRLIVSKHTIKSPAIDEAKRDLGGGQILRGRCTGDGNGLLVFESTKEPSFTVAKTIKAVITRDAGLTLKVDARKAPDIVDDEEQFASNSELPMPVLQASARGNGSAGAKPASPSPKAGSNGLPKKAKMIFRGMGRYEYDFGRPITKEQAAQVMFKDGKVPDEARLEPGPGANSWTLRTFDMEGNQATLRKMRARTETVIRAKPNPDKSTWNPPEPDDVTVEWLDVPSQPRTGPERADLNNNFGFKVTKHYAIDEGQSPTRLVQGALGTGKGRGYEVTFERAMTKAQVMDKLFDKDLGSGAVQLQPVTREPAAVWLVHMIGGDASGALKHPFLTAFVDAHNHTEESVAPYVPAGIRAHIENKTVAPGATKHPSDLYVWEQEGYLVRVITHGTGKDRYYAHETTKISHADEAGKITIRYFMIELGLPPREAWQEYVKHWDWIHAQIITGLALALSSGKLPGRAPAVKTGVSTGRTPVKGPTPTRAPESPPVAPKAPAAPQKPATNIGNAKTQPGPAQRPVQGHPLDSTAPGPQQKSTVATGSSGSPSSTGAPAKRKPLNDLEPKRLPDSHEITINTSNGPKKMTVGQYRRQVERAKQWMSEQRINAKGAPPVERELADQAAGKFGLNKNWQYVNNPYIH